MHILMSKPNDYVKMLLTNNTIELEIAAQGIAQCKVSARA